MSDLSVETEISPPEPDEDDDNCRSTRLSVSWMDIGDAHYDAAVQLFGDDCENPAKFADAMLRTALALANLLGPDHAWEAMRRFSAYDGGAA